MGIDISMSGSSLLQQERESLLNYIDTLKANCEAQMAESTERSLTDLRIDAALAHLRSGSMGIIRSSYNPAGSFNFLEQVFGIDPAGLLFPGNWKKRYEFEPKRFLSAIKALEDLAAGLTDSEPLPIREKAIAKIGSSPAPHPDRQAGEAGSREFAATFASELTLPEPIGNAFCMKEHGPRLRWELKNLRDFGELGIVEKYGRAETPVLHFSF